MGRDLLRVFCNTPSGWRVVEERGRAWGLQPNLPGFLLVPPTARSLCAAPPVGTAVSQGSEAASFLRAHCKHWTFLNVPALLTSVGQHVLMLSVFTLEKKQHNLISGPCSLQTKPVHFLFISLKEIKTSVYQELNWFIFISQKISCFSINHLTKHQS